MCTILVAWRAVPGAPLLIAANRDELRARPAAPAGVLDPGPPAVLGGRDLLAGGTWLAAAADGRVAAVTNRRVGERDPARRSRGELPLALLGAADPVAVLDGLDPAAYNPANVLWATADLLAVRHLDAAGEGVAWLGPGTHVLRTVDVDAPETEPLAARLEAAVEEHEPAGPMAVLDAMQELLRLHGDASLPAVCIDGDLYGTVSSTSVAVLDGGSVLLRAAQGPAHGSSWVEVPWPAS